MVIAERPSGETLRTWLYPSMIRSKMHWDTSIQTWKRRHDTITRTTKSYTKNRESNLLAHHGGGLCKLIGLQQKLPNLRRRIELLCKYYIATVGEHATYIHTYLFARSDELVHPVMVALSQLLGIPPAVFHYLRHYLANTASATFTSHR